MTERALGFRGEQQSAWKLFYIIFRLKTMDRTTREAFCKSKGHSPSVAPGRELHRHFSTQHWVDDLIELCLFVTETTQHVLEVINYPTWALARADTQTRYSTWKAPFGLQCAMKHGKGKVRRTWLSPLSDTVVMSESRGTGYGPSENGRAGYCFGPEFRTLPLTPPPSEPSSIFSDLHTPHRTKNDHCIVSELLNPSLFILFSNTDSQSLMCPV